MDRRRLGGLDLYLVHPAHRPADHQGQFQLLNRGGWGRVPLRRRILADFGQELVQGTEGPGLARRTHADRGRAGGGVTPASAPDSRGCRGSQSSAKWASSLMSQSANVGPTKVVVGVASSWPPRIARPPLPGTTMGKTAMRRSRVLTDRRAMVTRSSG